MNSKYHHCMIFIKTHNQCRSRKRAALIKYDERFLSQQLTSEEMYDIIKYGNPRDYRVFKLSLPRDSFVKITMKDFYHKGEEL